MRRHVLTAGPLLGLLQLQALGLSADPNVSRLLRGCRSKACHWLDHSAAPSLPAMVEVRLRLDELPLVEGMSSVASNLSPQSRGCRSKACH